MTFGFSANGIQNIEFDRLESLISVLMNSIWVFAVLFVAFIVLPYMMFFLAPHYLVISDQGVITSLIVSFEVFKKNWITYVFLGLLILIGGMLLAFLIGAFSEISQKYAIVIGVITMIFAFSFLLLVPFTILSLAVNGKEDDLIRDFGSN